MRGYIRSGGNLLYEWLAVSPSVTTLTAAPKRSETAFHRRSIRTVHATSECRLFRFPIWRPTLPRLSTIDPNQISLFLTVSTPWSSSSKFQFASTTSRLSVAVDEPVTPALSTSSHAPPTPPSPTTLSEEISSTDSSDTTETLLSKEFRPLEDVRRRLSGSQKAGRRRKMKPNLQPSFTFAAYVNESPILKELIHLGVDLTKWEKGRIPDEIVAMEPDLHLKPIVRHLRRLGVRDDRDVGKILVQNPFILINGLSTFKEKTDYFARKKFTEDQLVNIMKKAPQLFSRTVESIDARLGFFQTSYSLTGDQIRETVASHPELFQMKLSGVKKVNFHMNKFLGFKPNEIRELFVTVPSIFTMNPQNLQRRFDQLHTGMMIPHQSLVKFPYLLKVN